MADRLGIRRPLGCVLGGPVPEHDGLRQLSCLRQMMGQELRLSEHDMWGEFFEDLRNTAM